MSDAKKPEVLIEDIVVPGQPTVRLTSRRTEEPTMSERKRVYAIRADHGEPIGVVGEISSALDTLRGELEAIDLNDQLEFTVYALRMTEEEMDALPEI